PVHDDHLQPGQHRQLRTDGLEPRRTAAEHRDRRDHHRLDDGPHPLEVHQGEMATALPHRDPVLHRDRLPVRRVDRERARLRDHMTLARPDSRKADSMTDSHSTKKTIVFAGGGHAHLYSLRRTGELVDAGYEVVLINPS